MSRWAKANRIAFLLVTWSIAVGFLSACPTLVTRDGGLSPTGSPQAPEFQLKAQDGATVSLSSLIRSGPVILAFYRGQW